MTRKPSRLRRWMKWVGLVGCAVVLGLWCVSAVLTIRGRTSPWPDGLSIELGRGAIVVTWQVGHVPDEKVQRFLRTCRLLAGAGPFNDSRILGGWQVLHHSDLDFWTQLYATPALRPWKWSARSWSVIVPLWFLTAIVSIPTAILWYRDRRQPPGHCQACGYDLTGNVSGKCPEYGEAVR